VFELPEKSLAVQRVADRVAVSKPGEWIVGQGWTQDFWPDKQFPSAADLDPVSPDNPVYLRAKSGHAAWVNRRVLQIAGIDRTTPDPDGGHIQHDEYGEPTGLLFENAMQLASSHVPGVTDEQMASQMVRAQAQALASGLTAIHDFDGSVCLRVLQILRERGELSLRVLKNINDPYIEHAYGLGIRHGFGDDWIRIGGLKIFADGALGPRTALMVDPYEGEPDNYGIAVKDKEEIYQLVSRASAAGFPSTVHAIGDRAVHAVLDVYESVRHEEAARGELPDTRRHRIEHVQIVHPDDVTRLKVLNVIASMQPIHATSDYQMANAYWGARSRLAYNARIQIDQGTIVAFGSDSPIDPFDPLKGIYAAVTRRRPDGLPGPDGWYPENRLTLDEALRGFTIGPAYAAGLEDRQGQLAQGFLADLVVLDHDLTCIAPEEILETQALATMVDGQWRYGDI
jgi:predicted amidohydrolase YtcJ